MSDKALPITVDGSFAAISSTSESFFVKFLFLLCGIYTSIHATSLDFLQSGSPSNISHVSYSPIGRLSRHHMPILNNLL